MKQVSLTRRILYSLVALTTLLTACEKDYYDPTAKEDTKTISDIFGVDFTIPQNFDWSMIKTSPITVKVDDQFNGAKNYTVEILADNPIITPNARLLKRSTVRGNQALETLVTYPKANSHLYVRQIDPDGRRIVKMVDVSASNSLNVDFSSSAEVSTRSQLSTRSTEFRAGIDEPQRTYPTPANAQVISASDLQNILPSGKAYVLKEDYTGEINLEWTNSEHSFLYIESKWTNIRKQWAQESSFELRGWTVVIQNGGAFESNTTGTVSVNENSVFPGKLVIAEGATFNKDQKDIAISSSNIAGTQVINNGKLYASSLNALKHLYNYGTLEAKGDVTTNSQGATIYNAGSFSANNMDFKGQVTNDGVITLAGKLSLNEGGSTFDNNHYFTAKNIDINGASTFNNRCKFIVTETAEIQYGITFNISTGIFSAKNLVIHDPTINIQNGSIWKVEKEMNLKNSSTFNGKNNALIKVGKLTRASGWETINLKGSLEFESSSYVEGAITGNTASLVPEGESTILISPTDCNGGGNSPRKDPNPDPNPPVGMGYTYAFEDNWPIQGDYDMNDLVLYVQTSSDNARSFTIKATLKALGASKNLAAAIQLTNVLASDVTSVTRTGDINLTGATFDVSNNLESGQTNAVLPLFDNAHGVYGVSNNQMVNTLISGEKAGDKTVTLTVTFNKDINIDIEKNLDVFVVNGGSKGNRKEIHLRNFASTSKVKEAITEYSSTLNLVWGICVPGEFKYPLEYTNIISAYPEFLKWVTSNGNEDWYKFPDENKIYK